MLGVLIADEIKQIDREKNHQCAACQTNQTNRAIRVFVARNDCACPVCETAKDRIQGMGKKLDKLCDALNLEHQRIDPFINSAIFLAEHEQDIRNVAGLEGGVTYAARVIRGMIHDYDAIIEAAHAAYEMVAQATTVSNAMEIFTDTLNRAGRKVQDTTERLNREPPDHNVN